MTCHAVLALIALVSQPANAVERGGATTNAAIRYVVDAKIPAGNIVVEKIEGDTVRLSRELRDTTEDWFYWAFRVKGAKGRTLTFKFDEKIIWGGPVGVRGPAVTTDGGKTWSYPCDGRSTKSTFTYTFASDDEVRFYETWQYLPPEWNAFLAQHAVARGTKFETGVLCKTRKGRDVPNARFGCIAGTPKYRVFMSSRHHCSESTATPVLEGVAAAFLADDDLGRWLCANVELMLVPFVDYDGVIDGDQGKSRAPHDHNRDYTEFIYPETRAIRDWIMSHAGGRLDIFIDIHCPWIRENSRDRAKMSNEFLYTPWKDPSIASNVSLEKRYSQLLEELQCGSMRYRAADDLPFGRLWNTAGNYSQGMSAVIWACKTLKGLKIARTYEVPFANANGAVVTPTTCRELGRDTAKVFRALLVECGGRGATPADSEAVCRVATAMRFLALSQTRVTGGYWAPRFQLWRTKTVPDILMKLETKSHVAENFRLAAAGAKKGHSGAYFFDGLFYEAICGASDYLAQSPDPELEKRLDGYVDLIVAAQRPDGYLNTRVQIDGENHRWGDDGASVLDQHEIYDAGCLLEAGVHYYRATGKAKLLTAGIRFANLLCETIGPSPKRNLIPSHSLAEDALIQFVDLLAEDPTAAAKAGFPNLKAKPYLKLLDWWFANHGNNCGEPDWEKLGAGGGNRWCREASKKRHSPTWRPSYGDYQMDKKPLAEYASIEGHAVRATLLCAGLAAYARETGNAAYASLATRFWESMVGRKMYISGGVGAEAGLERFVEDYRLPPDAYLETCAAIGSAFFSLRMAELAGDGRYFDEVERVVYNALLTAVGSNGTTYTYQNPLNTKKGSRWDWHGCPCCPPMFLKLTGRLPSLACSQDAEGYRVNLFMDGSFSFPDVGIVQETRYPDEGVVRIRVRPAKPRTFALRIRVPGWARGCENPFGLYRCDETRAWRVTLDGKPVEVVLQDGYAVIRRAWKDGDAVELSLDVGERLIRADDRVADVRGKTARMRGPVLMACEKGRWIPYCDVANRGPAPHEVWSAAPVKVSVDASKHLPAAEVL